MLIISIFLIIATVVFILYQSLFFRKEKRVIQKYPFYKLRDEIVWKLITSKEDEKYLDIYDIVNKSIGLLKKYNYSFYSEVISSFFDFLLEEAYKDNYSINSKLIEKAKEMEVTPYHKKFITLVFHVAKENSFLVKLAMSKIGFKIFVTSKFIKAVVKFLEKHPDIFEKRSKKVKTLRDISYLNYVFANG